MAFKSLHKRATSFWPTVSRARLGALTVSLTLGIVGCNSAWEDPFTPPRVGEKFLVAPDPVPQLPMMAANASNMPRAILVRLDRLDDMSSSRSRVSSLGDSQSIKLMAITLYGRDGVNARFAIDQIKQASESSSCKAVEFEIREMLAMYQGMSLLCGNEFIRAFSNAGAVLVENEAGIQRQFTSWGSIPMDLGSYQIVIHSFSF